MDDFSLALNIKIVEATDISNKVNACIENLKQLQMQNLIDLLSNCYLQTKSTRENNFWVKANGIANVYFILGYLKAILFSKIPLIDPVLKVSLKQKYCLQEVSDFETFKTNYELLNSIYSDSPKTLHSYCGLLTLKINELKNKISKYEKYVAVRPTDTSYKSLSEVK